MESLRSDISPTRRDYGLLTALVLAALLVRVVWHLISTNGDWPDTATYWSAGQALFHTGFLNSGVVMPLYPILFASLGYDGILWFQILASAFTVGFVYLLSLELSGTRLAAILGSAIACFYPLLIFYANMRLSETTYIALTLLAFYLFYRGWFSFGSVVLVLSILVRPSIDLIAPFLILGFCMARGETAPRIVVRRLATYVLIYVVMMLPWWWHNWHLYGSFVRLNLGTGAFVIVENNGLFDKVGLDFQALAPAWNKFAHIADPIARDAAMKTEALAYIRSDPAHWIWRSIERFFRFWTPTPGSNSFLVNAIACLTTLPIIVLAMLAASRFRRHDVIRLAPIILLIVYFTAVHSAIHGIPRYRLPLDPFLIVIGSLWLASAGAASWTRWTGSNGLRQTAAREHCQSNSSTP